jgi:hypothetical protein
MDVRHHMGGVRGIPKGGLRGRPAADKQGWPKIWAGAGG